MKKNRELLYLPLVILCVWLPVFMGAFDKDKPASSTSLRNSNPEILANWSATETALDQDHDFTTGGTQTGTHDQITFTAPISTPTNAANVGFAYIKDVSAVVELHFLDESGNELQMTSAGSLGSATTNFLVNTITSSGLITANAGVTLGAGDDLIGSTTSGITIGTNVFTVADDDSGDTVIAGTLGVTGIATLGDASTLATSAAPSADAEIANKKYVDDQNVSHVGQIKAWANIEGIGTATLRDSYNVASVLNNGTGDYTITWTVAFSSASYVVVGTCQRNTSSTTAEQFVSIRNMASNPAIGSVRIITTAADGTQIDCEEIHIMVIGAQ